MLVALCSFAPLGCARIVADTSPYYVNGPNQPEPPQGFIKSGETVYVLGVWENHARFFNDDGISGAIWAPALVSPSEWDRLQESRKPRRLSDSDAAAPVIQGEGIAR